MAWRGDHPSAGERLVAAETPIALTYGRATHAVMLATPADLEDFAVGFSLAEGIIARPHDIATLDIVALPDGIECRMDLGAARLDALTRRHRHMAGPSGCGLCGLDSLVAAMRPPPPVPMGRRFTPAMIRDAMQAMQRAQGLNDATRAVHAAAFWTPESGLVAVREDVGRHNALDKLCGALARAAIDGAAGMVLLSSRVSVEMVQKTAIAGVPVLAAISAPTSLAIRTADAAGITLAGIARSDGCEVFSHPDRIAVSSAASRPCAGATARPFHSTGDDGLAPAAPAPTAPAPTAPASAAPASAAPVPTAPAPTGPAPATAGTGRDGPGSAASAAAASTPSATVLARRARHHV
ncbi:formate dehydrogenase accessory sulfurtransferase FdhD [Rhodopila sp.]|uniref:formate dehydrogenase accessory sulfurtransferase FdhD n=1 Tax=Rhodopila sp. TaxID=2480087 RepID=UPI002C95DE2F|nr:formate dehydrogenase accessory sulfurtransferase FdhD [Rhodopila sp.]HVZ07646.1 formate dehydrogenase accessory sulfurtransferase FdhD [Rhodopila sp.]